MSSIVTRSGKGSPLTHAELDDNFANLNEDKYQEGSTIGAVTPAAGTFTTLTATGQTDLGTSVGSPSLRVIESANASYPYVRINNASQTARVYASTPSGVGNLIISSAGSGSVRFMTRTITYEQFRVADTDAAVNYVQVTGAATTAAPVISAQGSDANIVLRVASKGNGAVAFSTNYSGSGTGNTQVVVSHTANSVNYLQLTGSAAGSAPVFSSQGNDTNIDLTLTAKGTGSVNLQSASVNVAKFLYETSTDTSFWKFRSRAGDGFNVGVVADGTASNIGFNISTKGNASSRFFTGDSGSFSGGVEQARVTHTASAVNYVQVTGAATGATPVISAQGSDTNVPLEINAKGTSNITFRSGSSAVFQAVMNAGGDSWLAANRMTGNANLTASSAAASNVAISLQTKGTGAIDLAAGSSGVNISNGGTVTAITRTGVGSGYTSTPTITISAPTTAGGVQATAAANMYANSPTVASGGTGYTVNDVLTVVGGTYGQAAQFIVTAVSGGVITAAAQNTAQAGFYTVIPTSPVSVTGGTGSGATFNATWGFSAATITNAGSGYVEQPTVSFSGGGGSGAAAYATVGSYAVIKSIGTGTGFVTNQAITFQTSGSITSGYPAFNIRDIGTGDSWYQMGGGSTSTFLIAKGNANASAYLGASGSGSVRFTTNGDSITEQMRVSHTASAVNYVQVTGAATGLDPIISVQGSDSNKGMRFALKGGGGVGYSFYANSAASEEIVRFTSVNGGNAYLKITGGSTGVPPSISVAGSDTNIDLALTPKGTGSTVFNTALGIGFKVVDPGGGGAINNYWQASGYSGAPGLAVSGSGTNVAGGFTSKGTGSLEFKTNGFAQLQFAVSHTASAVNYVQVTGAATGGQPVISTQGSDSTIPLKIQAKGTTFVYLQNASGTTQFSAGGTSVAVNWFNSRGAADGNTIQMEATGTSTNISAAFQSKGTGAIDLAAGSQGVNISNGGTVTAITRTAVGSGYTSIPSVTITSPTTAGGVQAVGNVALEPSSFTIVNGGSGYAVNDVVEFTSGTFYTQKTRLTVTTVSAGAITGVSIAQYGRYTVMPDTPDSVTTITGTGAGATISVATSIVFAVVITNAGSGYVEQPTVTFSGGGGSGAAAYATVGSTTTIKTIGNTLDVFSPAGRSFQVLNSPNPNPVSFIQASPNSTGQPAYMAVGSSDTNASMWFFSKGTGSIDSWTGGGRQFLVANTASAVNYVQVTGAATGNAPAISTQGSDANVTMNFVTKGSNGFVFQTRGGGTQKTAFTILDGGSSVTNSLTVTPANTGAAPVLASAGGDTNIGLVLQPKGTGALQAQQTDSTATGGNARGANAVDWQTARGSATNVASASSSVVAGGFSNTASAQNGVVSGGAYNVASNYNTTVVGGQANGASQRYAGVLCGYGNSATGYHNVIGGGYANSGTANSAVTTQATTTVTSGSTAVTLSGSNAAIKVGQLVGGTGIVAFPDTYVAAISGTSLTLSQAAQSSGTPTLSFYTPHGVVVGGGNNQATGAYSFIGGGGDAGTATNRNVASGDWSFVGGGNQNTASGIGSVVVGGGANLGSNIASSTSSFIGSGGNNRSAGIASAVVSGNTNTASAAYSFVAGGTFGTTRGITGLHVFPACVYPIATNSGVSQAALLVLGRQTTDATATVLTSDTNAANTGNQVILPNNSAYYFKGSVVAGKTAGGDTSSWSFEGTIKRGANAASTALVGTPVLNLIGQDAGASTWVVALTADTTNGGLAVTVTGQASTTIRWVAKIETTEMTF